MRKTNSGGNAAPEAKATPLFDTQKAVKSLREAGVSEAQAEAHVEVIKTAVSDNVATKADLVALRSETKADHKVLEAKVDATATKADLRALEVRLIKWNIATLIAVVGSIITLG